MHNLLMSMVKATEFSPKFITRSAWIGHVYFAAWLMQIVKPKLFLELGTHTGTSYFSFCQGVKEAELESACFAVDTWKGDEQAGFYGEDVFDQVLKINTNNFHQFSRLIRMTFDDALALFNNKTIDLLHIDGCHTYEAVKHDFESWEEKLSDEAIVCIHDTTVKEKNFGVYKYWEELTKQFPWTLSFEHCNGLGVLCTNKHKETSCYKWLIPESEEQKLVLNFFAALGNKQMERCRCNEHINTLTSMMHERDAQITYCNNQIEAMLAKQENQDPELYEQVEALTFAVADRDAQIQSLRAQTEGLTATLAKQYALVDELHKLTEQQKSLLSERDMQLTQRDTTLTKLHTQIAGYTEKLCVKSNEVENALADVLSIKNQLVGKKIELDRKSNVINQMAAQLRQRSRERKELEKKWYATQEKLAEQGRMLDNLTARLQESQRAKEALENHIKALRSSNSWRITKPLRQLTTSIRKVRERLSGKNISGNDSIIQQLIPRKPSVRAHKSFDLEQCNGISRCFLNNTIISGSKRFFAYEWDRKILDRLFIRPHSIPSYIDSAVYPPVNPSIKIAIHLHLYYTDMIYEFIDRFNTLPYNFDLFVSTRADANTTVISQLLVKNISRLQNVVVENVPNRGRDLAPFIITFGKQLLKYDVIAHFQSKKSVESKFLEHWGECILDTLIGPVDGSGGRAAYIIKLLSASADIVYPALPRFFPRGDIGDSGWGCNQDDGQAILEQYSDITLDMYPKIDFVAGSMFWAKAECLEKFLSLPLSWDDFSDEPIHVDGTLPHALERLILVFANEHKGDKIRIHEEANPLYEENTNVQQLYYDIGCGLNEEYSIHPDSYQQNRATFTIPKCAKQAKFFRFDPMNCNLTMELGAVVFLDMDNKPIQITTLESNAGYIDRNLYHFQSNDPWFAIHLKYEGKQELNQVQIDYVIHFCGEQGNTISSRAIKFYSEQNAKLEKIYTKDFRVGTPKASTVVIQNKPVLTRKFQHKNRPTEQTLLLPSLNEKMLSVFDSTKISLILGGGSEWNKKNLESACVTPVHFNERIDTIINVTSTVMSTKVAVHLHLYHVKQIGELIQQLKNIPFAYDLYVSINDTHQQKKLAQKIKIDLSKVKNVVIKKSPNKGGSIDSLVVNFGGQLLKYDVLLHLHSQKTTSSSIPTKYCDDKSLTLLLGPVKSTGGRAHTIMELVLSNKGVVFTESGAVMRRIEKKDIQGRNVDAVFGTLVNGLSPDFNPSGEMFWANASSLKELLSSSFSWEMIPDNTKQSVITLSHIISCANKHNATNFRIHACPVEKYTHKDVIFMVGVRGDTPRYRVNNIAEGLNELGYSTVAVDYSQWNKLLAIPPDLSPKILVLMRCVEIPRQIVEKIQEFRANGTKLVCDYDDLLFDPDAIRQSHALEQANITREIALLYKENLLRADIGTATTAYLARRMEEQGIPSFVIPNSLNAVQILKSVIHKKHKKNNLTIFYGSGTRSHDEDFKQCTRAIYRILKKYQNVQLMLMGAIEIPDELRSVQNSIIIKHGAAWRKYADVLGGADINIAPLENTPFNQGKSELKIFEAGIYGIPTIASPVESYAACINDQTDGLLVNSENEWYDSLKRLIDDADYRIKIGKNAKKKAMEKFTYKYAAKIAIDVYGLKN